MVDMDFLVFIGFFVSTTDLESFSLRPEKSPKRFSFGGGRVRFFLLCSAMEVVDLVSTELSGDREIFLSAVSQNWQALKWASDELRGCQSFLLATLATLLAC